MHLGEGKWVIGRARKEESEIHFQPVTLFYFWLFLPEKLVCEICSGSYLFAPWGVNEEPSGDPCAKQERMTTCLIPASTSSSHPLTDRII